MSTPLWITIGVDAKAKRLEMIGITDDINECTLHESRSKLPHVRSFRLDGEHADRLVVWLDSLGVPRPEVIQLVGKVAGALELE